MASRPTLRVLVVDDDPVLQNVLSAMIEGDGLRVVGRADTVDLALDVLERFTVDVAIVDLALRAGSGEDLLARAHVDHPDVRCAVFSSFVEDPEELLALGASAVFEKPSFDALAAWLQAAAAAGGPSDTSPSERRRPAQPAPPLPDRGRTGPSGFEPWQTCVAAVDGLWPGDAILALDMFGVDALIGRGDAMIVADHRITLSRLCAPALRDLDRIALTPAGIPVVLLVAGHQEAPAAVFKRLEDRWDREGAPGTPIGAFTHVRASEHPSAALGRTLDMLTDPTTTVAHPLRLA